MPLASLYDGYAVGEQGLESSDSSGEVSRSRSPVNRVQQFVRLRALAVEKPAGLDWVAHNCSSLAIDPQKLKAPLDKPLSVGTGCSCSGAPTHTLDQSIGRANYKEPYASEIHGPTRDWHISNFDAELMFHDIAGPRVGGTCTTAGFTYDAERLPQVGERDYEKDDIFCCGFVCKAFSALAPGRFDHSDVHALFNAAEDTSLGIKVRPFVETSRHIRAFRPKWSVLENSTGCMKICGASDDGLQASRGCTAPRLNLSGFELTEIPAEPKFGRSDAWTDQAILEITLARVALYDWAKATAMEHLQAKNASELKSKTSVALQSQLRSSNGALKTAWTQMEEAAKMAVTPATVAAETTKAMENFPVAELEKATCSEDGPGGLRQLLGTKIFDKVDRVLKSYRTISVLPSAAGIDQSKLDSLLTAYQAVMNLCKKHGLAILAQCAQAVTSNYEPQFDADLPKIFTALQDSTVPWQDDMTNLVYWIEFFNVYEDKHKLLARFRDLWCEVCSHASTIAAVNATPVTVKAWLAASNSYKEVHTGMNFKNLVDSLASAKLEGDAGFDLRLVISAAEDLKACVEKFGRHQLAQCKGMFRETKNPGMLNELSTTDKACFFEQTEAFCSTMNTLFDITSNAAQFENGSVKDVWQDKDALRSLVLDYIQIAKQNLEIFKDFGVPSPDKACATMCKFLTEQINALSQDITDKKVALLQLTQKYAGIVSACETNSSALMRQLWPEKGCEDYSAKYKQVETDVADIIKLSRKLGEVEDCAMTLDTWIQDKVFSNHGDACLNLALTQFKSAVALEPQSKAAKMISVGMMASEIILFPNPESDLPTQIADYLKFVSTALMIPKSKIWKPILGHLTHMEKEHLDKIAMAPPGSKPSSQASRIAKKRRTGASGVASDTDAAMAAEASQAEPAAEAAASETVPADPVATE
eukprot:TRINITY_DN5927_c0_g1_i4.p1 TRINITY_DN5927_c0_g1~~TRINITY_DN5927_c0_g1_i4.p1  ORF type:complete len:930 (+),score=182.93 TRINITY_DN5927_c0_g1_i4:52-2841(+)